MTTQTPATTSDRVPAGYVVAAVAIALVTTAVAVALGTRETIWLLEIDFKVYHMGGVSVVGGISPYDVLTAEGNPFSYPPFAALLFVPLGLMNLHIAFAVWTFLGVLALEASIWFAFAWARPETRTRRAKYVVLGTVAALVTAPVMLNFGVGQINVFLMLLVIADLARRPGRFQGVALGIAAAIKLTPLIFVAYLVFTRRIRAAVVAMVTFAATVLVGFLVVPGASARWWGELVLDAERMSPPGASPFNQSMRGVLVYLPGFLHSAWFWLVLAIVVGLAGLVISAWASRRGMEAAGVLACAVTGLLISPISWTFHWVWLAPGLALWLWWARRRRSAAHLRGVTLMWLVLVASAVLTAAIVAGVPNLAAADEQMPATLTTVVVLNALTALACLSFLGVLALVLRRGEQRSPVLG